MLCGQCKSGFSLAVYSLNLTTTVRSATVVIFLFVTLLPTTIVFLLVMVFGINANALSLAAFVPFCQIVYSWKL